ncbi:4Fe-4S dicluster domain-containing protein [Desulfitobacterium chlororespirans]|uniref:Ferredoxin n=1 Tax=Desulfitobacterium chlororespirans DSM 11544 TaxID=1121395 RepID=A0A1M7UB82_9FIRM|nr:4Fe-4S binding protein [Desulfitobacterium chlororespirans]SHN80178.1 4Fe-4S binding domain-containing protein [Desulfitobacterium chlororespirans DSM 11544]
MYTCQMVHHHHNCLNTKKPYVKLCRLCIDSCPHQAISLYRELNAQGCTECGICMAVCPSDGFVYYSIAKLGEFIRNAGKIMLNCPQAMSAGYGIPCLGLLDRDLWLTLLMIAREKEVTILTGVCAACPDKKACGMSVRIFKEIHNSWPDHPTLRIKVAPDDGESETGGETTSVQNRSGGKGWRDIGREKLEAMLPGITSDETYPIPKTRQFLEEAWRSRKSAIKALPLPALKVREGCRECGECAEVCPQGALTNKKNGEQLTLIYEPLKCVNCQRCVNICRSQALSMEYKSLSYRLFTGKILVHQGKQRL